MALVILVALIGVIVYFSRQGRREYLVTVGAREPGETWTFNVRDMSAELKVTSSSRVLETYDLRRHPDGGWEMAKSSDEGLDRRTWLPCDEAAVRALEDKYHNYNGDR